LSPLWARLSRDGELRVPSTTLDGCVYGNKAPASPEHHKKIDVEGAELEVLKALIGPSPQFRPAIFLEIHGTQLHAKCRAFLAKVGYHIDDAYGQMIATPVHESATAS